jgi:GNAT superfamily N-acetyltransferase
MKLVHLLRKAVFRSRMDGMKDMLRELVYVNRTMVVIEKDIRESRPVHEGEIRFVVVDSGNLKKYGGKNEWRIVSHYCSRGARCVMAYREGNLLGYQFYTRENSFRDLVKMGISMGKDEAYLFDLFVFPEHRGTEVPKTITAWTFNHLVSEGISKIYGFYYSDNIRSLWWHRAVLKCREIKRIRAHRIFFFEWTDRTMVGNS